MTPSEHWKSLKAAWMRRGALITFGVVLIVLAAWLLIFKGCGSSVTVRPGTAAVYQAQTRTIAPDGTVTLRTETGGESVGASGGATGDKAADFKADAAPAPIDLPGTDGLPSPGGIRPSTAPAGGAAKGSALFSNPLLWVGILLCCGGGAAIYFGLRRAAVIAFAVGGGFIVASMLPAVAWFIIAGVAVLGGGAYLWAEYANRRNREALRATVAGVEMADPAASAAVKAKIAEQADGADKQTIADVKAKDNL